MRLLNLFPALLAILVGALAAPVHSAGMPAPVGPVVLNVSGLVANRNADGGARFDMAMLQALPVTELVTVTSWTEGQTRFEGVLLRDLMAAVGAEGRVLRAVALNDYAVDIPADDAVYDVLVAYRMNGAAMSVRDKGPLWIIYPVSQHPDLAGPGTDGKMIWQLRDIIVQ